MWIVTGIVLILLGLLAASNLIAGYNQDAADRIETLRPIQGWAGILGLVIGLWSLVSVVLNVGGGMKEAHIIAFIPTFGGPIVLAAIGFLMGFGMISAMLANSREAREKADELYESLAVYQGPLGLLGIGLGVWLLFV